MRFSAPSDVSSITDRGLVKVVITTYGVLHGAPPAGDMLTVDLSRALRNPHHDPQMKYKTGLDRQVRDHVMATPGATEIRDRTVDRIEAARVFHDMHGEITEVGIYCKGGRHRSVAIAEAVAVELRARGINTEVEHRDIDKPVVATPKNK
ncbi:RapZ C-terminal domain-containing protein [Nocardiopsis valliformis]|uniref:RapZ C-terminal domain-containing protein n=1 Tax=Nocardiopsis valliformis TaxID=239974 RepID=UPI00034A240B|nr:RNase adapter RapZ [Nocardiopsis valliformis]